MAGREAGAARRMTRSDGLRVRPRAVLGGRIRFFTTRAASLSDCRYGCCWMRRTRPAAASSRNKTGRDGASAERKASRSTSVTTVTPAASAVLRTDRSLSCHFARREAAESRAAPRISARSAGASVSQTRLENSSTAGGSVCLVRLKYGAAV